MDGKTAWFYVPSDHTVTRAPARESTDWRTPLALLAGEMKLSRVCARIDFAVGESPETPGDVVLDCHVRGNSGDRRKPGTATPDMDSLQDTGAEQAVYFEVVPATGDLARVLVRQKGAVSVDFRFGGWRFDPPLPAGFFHFDVPQGVAIVDGENPGEMKP